MKRKTREVLEVELARCGNERRQIVDKPLGVKDKRKRKIG